MFKNKLLAPKNRCFCSMVTIKALEQQHNCLVKIYVMLRRHDSFITTERLDPDSVEANLLSKYCQIGFLQMVHCSLPPVADIVVVVVVAVALDDVWNLLNRKKIFNLRQAERIQF